MLADGSSLKLEHCIACGGFGAVYQASGVGPNGHQSRVCVKIPHDIANDQTLTTEATLAAKVKGYEKYAPRIVSASYKPPTYKVWSRPITLSKVAVMEEAPYGTLKDLVEQNVVTKHNIEDCIRMVAHNLAAIHSSGILHRDISPCNILAFPAEDGGSQAPSVAGFRLVIADYGIATCAVKGGSVLTMAKYGAAGKPGFCAPEVANGGAYNFMADWYSFGVSMLVIAGYVFDGCPAKNANLYLHSNEGLASHRLRDAPMTVQHCAFCLLPTVPARTLFTLLRLWIPLGLRRSHLVMAVVVYLLLRFGREIGGVVAFGACLGAVCIPVCPFSNQRGFIMGRSPMQTATSRTNGSGDEGKAKFPLWAHYMATSVALAGALWYTNRRILLVAVALAPVGTWGTFIKGILGNSPRGVSFPSHLAPDPNRKITTTAGARRVAPADGSVFNPKCVRCNINFTHVPAKWTCPTCKDPVWQPDGDSAACIKCNKNFTIFGFWRHHCRRCGWLFCRDCTAPSKQPVPSRGYEALETICKRCEAFS